MRGEYEYFRVVQSMDSIEVEDIGNCALRAFTDEGLEYLLVVDTKLGETRVFTFGPILPDIEVLPTKVICTYEKIKYAESRIDKAIKTFVNQQGITQVENISREEALEDCRSIPDYMRQFDLF